MRIVVVTTQMLFAESSTELTARALCQALRMAGHEADQVRIPFEPADARSIVPQMLAHRLLDLTESMGTRIDRLVALEFPGTLIPHPAKRIWLQSHQDGADEAQYRPFGGLAGTDAENGGEGEDGGGDDAVVQTIRRAETAAFREAGRVLVVAERIEARLRRFHGVVGRLSPVPTDNAGWALLVRGIVT